MLQKLIVHIAENLSQKIIPGGEIFMNPSIEYDDDDDEGNFDEED